MSSFIDVAPAEAVPIDDTPAAVARPQPAPMFQRFMNMLRPNRIRPLVEAQRIFEYGERPQTPPPIRASLPPDEVARLWTQAIDSDPIVAGIRRNQQALERVVRTRRRLGEDARGFERERQRQLDELREQYRIRIRALREDIESQYGSLPRY
jgi:hypothetical protein